MDKRKKKTKNGRKRLSAEIKMDIVRGYYLEGRKQQQLAAEFGVGQQTVSRIIRTFAAENDNSALLMGRKTTDNQAEEIQALRREIMDMKKKVQEEQMRADFYETMVDVAEEMFGIEIRKKAGTGQSKGCTRTK